MNTNIKEFGLRFHNFYLIGRENYKTDNLKFKSVNLKEVLPPTKFKFRETIQEIGLDTKLRHENFKYYEEAETITVFEPFHFKDFDILGINIWSYYELFFHQSYLFGVSFNINRIEIYPQLLEYLVQIYGSYQIMPDQDNLSSVVAWYFENPIISIYLEIEQKGSGEKFIVLTYYDEILRKSLTKPYNIYPLIRGEAYLKDSDIKIKQSKKDFISKFLKNNNSNFIQKRNDFLKIKSNVEILLSNESSNLAFGKITNYIIDKISPQGLNLEIADWLVEIAVRIQENRLFDESEKIYNLLINWYYDSEFTPNKERIILISNVYKNLVNVYGDNNKNDDAINSFNECIRILDDNLSFVNNYNYSFIAGQANYNIARVYNSINEQNKAIEHSRKAIGYFEPFVSPWINNIEVTSIILFINNLGIYLKSKGDYEEALNAFETGLRFAKDNNRYYDFSVINMNLAKTYVKIKKYMEAGKQYNLLLELIAEVPKIYNGTLFKGQVLMNMADMYKNTEEKEKEIECLNAAILFYEDVLSEHPEMEKLIINLIKRKSEI